MPAPSSYALSGLWTSTQRQRLLYELAFAYSTKWNNRRLECHLYGFWGDILNALTADLGPNLFVIPQYKIYTYAGNTESNPNDSNGSRKGSRAGITDVVPDFSIICAVATMRGEDPARPISGDLQEVKYWAMLQIKDIQSPFLMEVKKFPSRGYEDTELDQYNFAGGLVTSMDEAMTALVAKYARSAFRSYKSTKNIVLVAVVGEWWAYKLVKRGEYYNDADVEILRDDDEVDIKEESDDDDAFANVIEDAQFSNEDVNESGSRHVQYMFDEHPNLMQPAMDDRPPYNLDTGTARSSGYMLIGSSISNQYMFLIHRFLRETKANAF